MSQQNNREAIRCPSCNTEFKGDYCYHCGERKLDQKQRCLKFLLANLFESFTDIDSKLWRTFRIFLFEPGKLPLLHFQGSRKNQLKPITLFIFISIIYFIFTPISDFNLSLYDQLHGQDYSTWLNSVIQQRLIDLGKSENEITQSYNLLSPVVSKTLFFINIPIFSIFVVLLNYNKKFVYLDHFIFSLYITCFIIFLPLLVAPIMYALNFIWHDIPKIIPLTLVLVFFLTFLFLSQKKMYQNSNLMTSLKTLGLLIVTVVTHFLYRFLQFWATWWSLDIS